MNRAQAALATLSAAAALAAVPAGAQLPPPGTVARPAAAATRPVVVPDRFLRRWDPITVFFPGPVGGPAGAPEARPGRYVRIEPTHPVGARWIDARTLQLRPVDPWRPLARYTVTAGPTTVRLVSLLPPPTASEPADGATGLEPVSRIVLTFPVPLEARDLERMVAIELTDLPGATGQPVRRVPPEAFHVKPLEGGGDGDGWRYAVILDEPIPGGTAATVRLRLALDETVEGSAATIRFATVPPFRIAEAGPPRVRLAISPAGTRATREQALRGGPDRRIVVAFTAEPEAIGPVEGRNLVRITPPVEDLRYTLTGRTLTVEGAFADDVLYRVRLEPVPLRDRLGRTLEMEAPSEFFVLFPPRPPFLRWKCAAGIVERYGPRTVPVTGRGRDRLDLRIQRVDPLDRGFWPFPEEPVTTDDAVRPPGPGQEPGPWEEAWEPDAGAIAERIIALGSPPVSTFLDLPFGGNRPAGTFGLDIGALLDRIGSPHPAGTFLLGMRQPGGSTSREWMRVQATDLALTTVAEPGRARVYVTSLATAMPVAGARVVAEAVCPDGFTRWLSGTTDGEGRVAFDANPSRHCGLARVWVRSGDDTLVLGPGDLPERFEDGAWLEGSGGWLEASLMQEPDPSTRSEHLAHLRTERPVYRPGEPVHVLGYVRLRDGGVLTAPKLDALELVVDGPGEYEWRHPVALDDVASFSEDFDEEDAPAGRYTVRIEAEDHTTGGSWVSDAVAFRIEAYRIPRFEVILSAPDRAPLDAPFEVRLGARYYAGGRAAGLPVAWRVTQFPLDWSPPALDGFLFSSDSRYSGSPRFESTGRLERQDVTDDEGTAVLPIDPTLEPTAQPRTYVVEATVTGADGQTVTSTRRVEAVPPFVLGLAAPRFLEPGERLEPRIVVVDGDGRPVAGREVEVTLIERQWHSYLRAGDFTTGTARYVTDVVETPVATTTVTSAAEPVTVPLDLPHSGVWIVRLTARDRMGRAQTVAVDLYAASSEPVGWAKPPEKTLRVATDRDRYEPGQTATFVVESPFQSGRVLAVVETPAGASERWLDVEGGTATLRLPVEPSWAPAIPVHFVLMRGRLEGTAPVPGTSVDLGRPTTLAATRWIEVEPTANRLGLELELPRTALPGATVSVTIRLTGAGGRPTAGRAALWMVDRAVLALGRERTLDPLKTFLRRMRSLVSIVDTRNLAFGWIPFTENPGGGEGAARKELLDRTTVRRNFRPVAYWNPSIPVGPDGTATVSVTLPDNLTDFAVRATAASGMERFGSAKAVLSVRLPVIVQSALPRFVRSGDTFSAVAVARVVEGPGGPGRAEFRIGTGPGARTVRRDCTLEENAPVRIEAPVTVPAADPGKVEERLVVEAAVKRLADGASDAFEARLPLLPDRTPSVRARILRLEPGGTLTLDPVPGPVRDGAAVRHVVLAAHEGAVRMAGAMETLIRYPLGCTEQRIARARGLIAAGRLMDTLRPGDGDPKLRKALDRTLAALPGVVDERGYVAYWPGAAPSVSLTAWTAIFLADARDAGYPVDGALLGRLRDGLLHALRSDSRVLLSGAQLMERAWALAALARLGSLDPAYAAELARAAGRMDLESTALVLQAVVSGDTGIPRSTVDALAGRLVSGVVVRLRDGREVYGGLDEDLASISPFVLPSEARTLATMIRALLAARPDAPRLPLMVDGLLAAGDGLGWGSTNADAAAMEALADVLARAPGGGTGWSLAIRSVDGTRTVRVDAGGPIRALSLPAEGPVTLTMTAGETPLTVLDRCRWLPEEPGAEAEAESSGLVVQREALLVRPGDAPPVRVPLDGPGRTLELETGRIVEEHVRVVNPVDRTWIAVIVPLAAGMEPLNPALATAPPEARPAHAPTVEPAYTELLDDRAIFYFTELPAGTHDLYFRTRAVTPGRFVQPPARAEAMYGRDARGSSPGAWVAVRHPAEGGGD